MKRCSRCGNDKPLDEFGKRAAARDGLHPWCKVCTREYARNRYAENPEPIRAAVQQYREQNREQVRERDRERYIRDKDKRAAWWQTYYQNNRDAILKRVNAYGKANRERCREAEARYRDSNRDKRRAAGRAQYRLTPIHKLRAKAVRNSQRRRARKRQATVVFFAQDVLDEKLEYWGRKCWVCGEPMEAIDHVKPLAKGGPHTLANLRPICNACNGQKADKWPFENLGGR